MLRTARTSLATVWLLAAAVLLTNPWLCFGQEAAAPDDAALRFTPADTLAYARVSVGQLVRNPAFELYPTEVVSAASQEQLGFDPLLIESLDVAVGMPGFNGPAFGAVVRLREAVAVEDLSGEVIGGEPYEEQGRKFYPTTSPLLHLHQVDPQTYLVGTPGYLQAMLVGEHGDSKLKSLVRTAVKRDPAFLIAVDLEPLRPLLQGGLEQGRGEIAPQLYPDLETLVTSVDRAVLMQTLGEEASVQLAMVQASPQAAKDVAASLRNLLNVASEMIIEQIRKEPAESEAIGAAAVAYVERITAHLKREFNPQQSGNNVLVQYKTDGDVMSLGTIGVLTGLLLPAVNQAREAARRVQFQNNMRQVGLSLLTYEEKYGKLPADIVDEATGQPLLSWRVAILPLMDEQDLYDRFHLDEPWNSPHNLPLLEEIPATYQHPSSAQGVETRIVMPTGEGFGLAGVEHSEVTDGLSNTVMAVEVPEEAAVPWSAPGDLEIDPEDPLAEFESAFPGFHALFGDGSVRYIAPSDITADTFRSVLTRAAND